MADEGREGHEGREGREGSEGSEGRLTDQCMLPILLSPIHREGWAALLSPVSSRSIRWRPGQISRLA